MDDSLKMDKELQILKSAASPDILAIYINKSSSLCSKCVNRKIIISTAGALRIGSPGDFRPLVQPSTYSFWASEAVCGSLHRFLANWAPANWALLWFGGKLGPALFGALANWAPANWAPKKFGCGRLSPGKIWVRQIGPRPWQLLVPNSFGGTLIAYNRNIPCMITGGLHKPGRQWWQQPSLADIKVITTRTQRGHRAP